VRLLIQGAIEEYTDGNYIRFFNRPGEEYSLSFLVIQGAGSKQTYREGQWECGQEWFDDGIAEFNKEALPESDEPNFGAGGRHRGGHFTREGLER